jgi:hypothetical protein
VPYSYSIFASTNSAASIHLPVPVVTDPQHVQTLTRIFPLSARASVTQIRTSKGDARGAPSPPSLQPIDTYPDCEPRAAMWEHYSGQDQAISRQDQETRSGTSPCTLSLVEVEMRRLLFCITALALWTPALLRSQSTDTRNSSTPKEKLIGAWHLVSMEEPGSDGKLRHITNRTGQLIHTRDGHMSVQIMYPPSESSVSNDYVRNGYEASFGSYSVDESAHTVTHHVQASVTHGLVGKDLTRRIQFSNGQLIIESTRPDEHWSVTWRHE